MIWYNVYMKIPTGKYYLFGDHQLNKLTLVEIYDTDQPLFQGTVCVREVLDENNYGYFFLFNHQLIPLTKKGLMYYGI